MNFVENTSVPALRRLADNELRFSENLSEIQTTFGSIYVIVYSLAFFVVVIAACIKEDGASRLRPQQGEIEVWVQTQRSNDTRKIDLGDKNQTTVAIENENKNKTNVNQLDELQQETAKTLGTACFGCEEIKEFSKKFVSRIKKYKAIYLTAIVHFSDIITDYLVLCQYCAYAIDEVYYGVNYSNVNYVGVCGISFLILLLSKIVSCYFVYIFTRSKFDVLLNIFDFYLFKEIYDSHKAGNKTDLMRYLQKIEKIYESAPQFTLQSYVLLRRINGEYMNNDDSSNEIAVLIQTVSILSSIYAISDKLINDDKTFFIKASGANKTSPCPSIKYVIRVVLRVCEVVSNLFMVTIITVFFGVFWCSMFVLYLLLLHYILYKNGLLDNDMSNVFAYIAAVMNLGITPTTLNKENSGNNTNLCLSKINATVINVVYNKKRNCVRDEKCKRYLSYYYIKARCEANGVVGLVILVVFHFFSNLQCADNHADSIICKSHSSRYANEDMFLIYLYSSLVCTLLTYLLYIFLINSFNLGVSIARDTKTLVLNYQFSDALRLEFIRQRNKNSKSFCVIGAEIAVISQILNIIIKENVQLLLTDGKKYGKSANATKEVLKEHIFLINKIASLLTHDKNDEFQFEEVLIKTLNVAIEDCHATMIDLLIKNRFINYEKVEQDNMLQFIVERCGHRIDIIRSIITENSKHIDDFEDLLEEETGNRTMYNTNERVIHLFLKNNSDYLDIISYFVDNYRDVFIESDCIRYLIQYEFEYIISNIKLPISIVKDILQITTRMIDISGGRFGFQGFKPQSIQIAASSKQCQLIMTVVENHNLFFNDLNKFDEVYAFEFCGVIFQTHNYQLVNRFVRLNRDLHLNLQHRYIANTKTNFLAYFIKRYYKKDDKQSIKCLECLVSQYQQRGNLERGINYRPTIGNKKTRESVSSLEMAVFKGYIEAVKIMLKYGSDFIDPQKSFLYQRIPPPFSQEELNFPRLDSRETLLHLAVDPQMRNLLIAYSRAKDAGDSNFLIKATKSSDADDNDINNKNEVEEKDGSVGNVSLKTIYENILFNLFHENNFVLFDVILSQCQDLVNLHQFGPNQASLLKLLDKEYGNSSSGDTSMSLYIWLTILEKYLNPDNCTDADLYSDIIKDQIYNLNKKFLYAIFRGFKFSYKPIVYEMIVRTGDWVDLFDLALTNDKMIDKISLINSILEYILENVSCGTYLAILMNKHGIHWDEINVDQRTRDRLQDELIKIESESSVETLVSECEERERLRTEEMEEKNYSISTVGLSNLMLNLYARYFDNREYSNDIKYDFVQRIILNKLYFCNQDFHYQLTSNSGIIGTVESNTVGLYLFHDVLKNAKLFQVFQQIIDGKLDENNNYNNIESTSINDNYLDIQIDESILLLFNQNKELPIECLVFGSYNQLYSSIKFATKDTTDTFETSKYLINLIHKLQYQTIKKKFNCIQ